ncbi:uncharacterized protein LOC115258210 isoform X2 [Aedes albopictus]
MLPRTPPNNTQKNSSQDANYPCCNEDDQYDAMVQCSRCKRWHHFSCVGVDQSIAELVWYCRTCLGEDVSARESLGQPGVSRVQPPRAAKKGSIKEHTGKSKEDQKKIVEIKDSRHSVKGGTSQAGPSRTGGEINIDKIPTDPSHGRNSVSGRKSCSESHKSGSSKTRSSKRDMAMKRIEEMKERSRLEALEEETQLQMLKVKQKQIERQRRELEELQQLSKLIEEESVCNEDLEEAAKSDTSYIDKVQGWMNSCNAVEPGRSRRSNIASDVDVSQFSLLLPDTNVNKMRRMRQTQQRSSSVVVGPTALQIASRQVFPKNLPAFSGQPQDWPLFISAYEQANASCGFTNAENLVRLQQSLQGKAIEIVRSLLLLPENVPTIIEKLRRRFGNPEILSTMLAQRIQRLEGPDSDNLESVIEFGSAIGEFIQHLEVSKLSDHLKNPILMQSLIQKLPPCYAMQWVEYKRNFRVVDLKTFGKFMEDLVDKALEVTFERIEIGSSRRREKPKAKVYTHLMKEDYEENYVKNNLFDKIQPTSVQSSQKKDFSCSICDEPGHLGRDCREFRNTSLERRWMMVKHMGLCTLCIFNHGKWPCRSKVRCEVDGCNGLHHTLLHPPMTEGANMEARCNSHTLPSKTALFRIIPVTLYGENRRCNTLALVDEGSSTSLIDNEIAEFLQLNGPREPFEMRWTNGVSRTETHSRNVEMRITGIDQRKEFELCVARTVTKLDLPAQQLDADELIEEFRHLNGVEIQSYKLDTPKLLIGIDNMHLIAPVASRIGQKGQPVAVKCKLGWTIYGPRPNILSDVHFLGHHRCACDECSKADQDLNQMLRDNFQLEAVGVSPVRLESKDDCKAREILQRTTRRIGDRFETGLLWKDGAPNFPKSYAMAYKRMKNLEARLDRNPSIREVLQKQIDEYVAKGYAHKITESEMTETPPERCWYLPLNYVVNPKKPGKIRMVWDAAAKANGVSFNESLLKGPDLVASLSGVINGFRERKVAFGGDIREMFHQILVRQEDRQAQRFLFKSDVNREPDIYVMDVVIFGASCSPCLAQFVKNLNAQEHLQDYPAAADAIIRKHYVDDYFDSVDTEDEAIVRAKEVRKVHADAGFEIRNWMSNSPIVLEELGEAESKTAKSFDVTSEAERVLGVMWRPDTDSFVFSTEFRDDLRPYIQEGAWPTKRIALRCIMSMFDPKQFLAPILIHGRILMQDLWRSGIGWDERIGPVHYDRWLRWTELFPLINNISIPRCYLGRLSSTAYETMQLHVFTDAGEDAYGCVAYFRFADGESVHCAFVEAKAKVAPLQYLSIPRKELEAAVLGARLMKAISENHSVEAKKRFLWTDSNAVASWVKSDVRRYKPFVAHRIGEILSITTSDDWHWVPTKCNPADDVTKWGPTTQISSGSRWFCGPDFLRKPESDWPAQRWKPVEIEEELRASVLLHDIVLPDAVLPRIKHISKWKVLVRTVASIYRFVSNCRRRINKLPIEALPTLNKGPMKIPGEQVPLRQEEYQLAENFIWRVAQGEQFPDDVKTLIKNQDPSISQRRMVEKSSPLYRLSPFLDEHGVIRMEGRTTAADYATFDVRFPIILPKEHIISRKLVERYHQECGHGSREMVVNEVLQRFYIPCLRSLVDRIARDCVWCKVQKAKPAVPRMAPLPISRMAVREHPFSYVGLDYFGPVEVVVGRRREKRWIALFTCMTVRAVHLELVYSLTTQSCEMAIRRFVKRRGSPVEIFSDNGTNFVGASRDLAEQIRSINSECADTFTGARTKWTFNPPSAPHMGGVWERMVRSVKEAMAVFAHGERITDEILQTTLIEAESLINSRPLTYVSTNVQEDMEALTPNHFLRSCSLVDCMPSRNSIELADRLRSSYNQAQYLAEELWRRWQREYLPMMNRRTKWFDERTTVAIGDLVYVADSERRKSWERGVVEEVFAGNDGRIRSAMVRTSTGMKKRAVAKLAVLEIGG